MGRNHFLTERTKSFNMKKPSLFDVGGTLAFALCLGATSASAAPWSFGVLSDTQWTSADDGKSPESVPASMIQQIDQAFIAKGVKLVIAVGDTVDTSTPATLATRALYSQDLYNAGIAFYPLRGNHDAELAASGVNFATLFPQIVNGGTNNLTPLWDTPFWIENNLTGTDTGLQSLSTLTADFNTGVPPATPAGSLFGLGGNFSYPTVNCPPTGNTAGNGLSYSFDYNNTRFVLLDQFVDSDLGGNTSSLATQQPWISQQVSDPNRPAHAFVFSHKQLLGGNHKDNLFGANTVGTDPGDGAGVNTNSLTKTQLPVLLAKQQAEDAFISSLAMNNVHYLITGHDHHHVDSIVQSPLNPAMTVHEIISQSDSSKFYTPAAPFSTNEISISEDLYQVGYYIYTVDGPRVTVDYYTVPANTTSTFAKTPVLTGNWEKALTLGYSLNGQEFQIAQGSSYTTISDNTTKAIANAAAYGESGYLGTIVQILDGTNGSILKTHDGRKLTRVVDTGWAPANETISDIVTLWGLTDLASIQSDTIAVSVSFNISAFTPSALQNGQFCLGSRDLKSGEWINAVDGNIVGGTKHFVYGPYSSGYGLGTWGIDPAGTAWAVVNGNNRDFAVIPTPTALLPWDFDGDGEITTADLNLLNKAIITHSTNPAYDLTGDGKVDSSDARWLSLHFTHVGGVK
jgi:hypothetical protein